MIGTGVIGTGVIGTGVIGIGVIGLGVIGTGVFFVSCGRGRTPPMSAFPLKGANRRGWGG